VVGARSQVHPVVPGSAPRPRSPGRTGWRGRPTISVPRRRRPPWACPLPRTPRPRLAAHQIPARSYGTVRGRKRGPVERAGKSARRSG